METVGWMDFDDASRIQAPLLLVLKRLIKRRLLFRSGTALVSSDTNSTVIRLFVAYKGVSILILYCSLLTRGGALNIYVSQCKPHVLLLLLQKAV